MFFPLLLFFALLIPSFPPHFTTTAATADACTTTTSTMTYAKCAALPTQQASIAWTYHARNSTLHLAFFGTFLSPSGWVAWGINPNSPQMTGTRAVAAFSDPASGKLLLLPFFLDPSVKLQPSQLITSRPLDIPLIASSAILLHGGSSASAAAGSTVEIHVILKLKPNFTKVHHVWNRGLYVQGYSPTIHPTTVTDLASRATFDVITSATKTASTSSPTTTPPQWVRPAHAILNSVSWGFLLPAGVATARYLRQCGADSAAGRPTWFYAHLTVQATGLLLGTAGIALGVWMATVTESVAEEYGLHQRLGIAVFCMGALQALALFFRPRATHRFRKYWKSYHHLVGYGCVVVGVVNVFQGFEAAGLQTSFAMMGYCLALATVLGCCVALEVNSWIMFCRSREEKGRDGVGGGRWNGVVVGQRQRGAGGGNVDGIN